MILAWSAGPNPVAERAPLASRRGAPLKFYDLRSSRKGTLRGRVGSPRSKRQVLGASCRPASP